MHVNRSHFPKLLPAVVLGCVVATVGCQKATIQPSIRQHFQAPQGSPRALAVYMPWFGDGSHLDVGYSSRDPNLLRRQIEQARDMGISAFLVDWNGERRQFTDQNFALLEQVASESRFQVALLYNEAEDNDGDATQEALHDLDRAYRDYIGPQAPHRDAYLTYNGRPLIFIFPKHGRTDWDRVRQHVNNWESAPLLFYKDHAPQQFLGDFDGFYAWVHPGKNGWASDGSDWGEQYLEDFYQNMKHKYPDKIPVGAAWPGFDDSRARWGLDRHMSRRCGKTLDDTLRLYRRYYDDSNPLPFLLIETWNDYEEGTAVERSASSSTHCSG